MALSGSIQRKTLRTVGRGLEGMPPALAMALLIGLAVAVFSAVMLLATGPREPISTPQPVPGACAPFCGSGH